MSSWPVEVIDADGHVYERDEELYEYLEAPYSSSRTVLGFPFWPTLDGWHRGALQSRLRVHEVLESSAPQWVDYLDRAGISRTVLYPTSALTCGVIQDRDWAVALVRAYNDWLHHRYLSASPRLHGMALLPLRDPTEAAAELRRAVTRLGMLGAVLTPIGLPRPLGDAEFDPIYREAEQLGCAIAVHAGPSRGLGLDYLERFAQMHALSHPFAQMIQVTSIVMSGVLDRFPGLRLAFLEAGASWVPFLTYRMDRSYAGRKFPEYTGGVVRAPSTYITAGNVFFNAEPAEDAVPQVIEVVGSRALLYTSDFPHEVNLAHSRAEIEMLLRRPDIDEESKAAILAGNARRLYRLP